VGKMFLFVCFAFTLTPRQLTKTSIPSHCNKIIRFAYLPLNAYFLAFFLAQAFNSGRFLLNIQLTASLKMLLFQSLNTFILLQACYEFFQVNM